MTWWMWLAVLGGGFIGVARLFKPSRCAYCGKGLRGFGLGYAPVCHHCGRDQPIKKPPEGGQ
jgi:hypothetical protein